MRLTEEEYKKLTTGRVIRWIGKPNAHQSIPLQPQQQENTPQGKIESRTKQTKTELEYGRMLEMEFPGSKVIPWGITLRMLNNHKYTPDFCVISETGILLVEVKQRGKNGFRQNSYQRAKLAYDQCKVEYGKHFTFRWAEKHMGQWSW